MIKINQTSVVDALSPIANSGNALSDHTNDSIGVSNSFSELFNRSQQQDNSSDGANIDPSLSEINTEDAIDKEILTQAEPSLQQEQNDEVGVANAVHIMQNALKSKQTVAEDSDEFPASPPLNVLNESVSDTADLDASPQTKSDQPLTKDKYSDEEAENNQDDFKTLNRLSADAAVKTENQNKSYVREISTTLNNIYQSISTGIEEFQSSNANSGSITIRIKPSTLGEIIITLEQPDLARGQERSGTHLVDARIYTANSEVANYLNLIRRDIYSQGMVRTLSIQSGMNNKGNNEKSSVHDQSVNKSEQGSNTDKNFFFNGQEKEEIDIY